MGHSVYVGVCMCGVHMGTLLSSPRQEWKQAVGASVWVCAWHPGCPLTERSNHRLCVCAFVCVCVCVRVRLLSKGWQDQDNPAGHVPLPKAVTGPMFSVLPGAKYQHLGVEPLHSFPPWIVGI